MAASVAMSTEVTVLAVADLQLKYLLIEAVELGFLGREWLVATAIATVPAANLATSPVPCDSGLELCQFVQASCASSTSWSWRG